MKRKRRPVHIAPPTAIPGVELALSRHLWIRAALQTDALESANADEETMCRAIDITKDLRNRHRFTKELRRN